MPPVNPPDFCRINGRTYRLSPDKRDKDIKRLHRVKGVSEDEEGVVLGGYMTGADASKALKEMMTDPVCKSDPLPLSKRLTIRDSGSVNRTPSVAWDRAPLGVHPGTNSNPHDADSVWDCRYLVAWVTRHRYQVLIDDIGQRCYEVLCETARARELLVHAGSINKDHVRLLLSIPPTLSVFRAVRHLKACSSYQLLSEFEGLRKRYRGKHVWARGYWVAGCNEATNETLAPYINSQSVAG